MPIILPIFLNAENGKKKTTKSQYKLLPLKMAINDLKNTNITQKRQSQCNILTITLSFLTNRCLFYIFYD